MGGLTENINYYQNICKTYGSQLIAVSKTKPTSLIMEAYEAGQRIFGENKVQEMCAKYEELPKDIQWHLIGHLQKNKVKYMASFVSLIHSVDSLTLLAEINKQAAKHSRVIPVLLQIFIATEETKFGLNAQELIDLLESSELSQFQNIKIVGLMGMASFTDNQNQITNEFNYLKNLFDKVKAQYHSQNIDFKELSMGMSSDYELALAAGSTMVRVGSSLFGSR